MNPFKQRVIELADQAKALHTKECGTSLESVDLVGELQRRNASGYLLLKTKDLARRVGLSPSQYWKRAQAARVLTLFPKVRSLIIAGETSISNVALIAPKVTQANLEILLTGIRGKTAREVKDLVKRVDFNGSVTQAKPGHSREGLIDRALRSAAAKGRRISRRDLIDEALELWLIEWEDSASTTKAG